MGVKRVCIVVDDEVWKRFKQKASKDCSSASEMIRILIRDYLKGRIKIYAVYEGKK